MFGAGEGEHRPGGGQQGAAQAGAGPGGAGGEGQGGGGLRAAALLRTPQRGHRRQHR